MKQISGSHYFLHLFTNSTSQHLQLNALSLRECKLVFCSVLWRVYVGKMFSLNKIWHLIGQYRSRENEERLVSQNHLSKHKYSLVHQCKSWQILQLFFSYPCWSRWFIFTNMLLLYYFELLFTAIWFKFFKIGVFKNFAKFSGKYLYWGLFLIIL